MPDRSVSYVFKGNFTNLGAGLTAMSKGTQELGTKLTALDKNGRQMRAGLTEVGSTAGKVGLVAAAGFTVAIGAAARFDKAMSAVQAATHETTGNMEALRDAAVKAGADTVYSASEAAGAIEELAKAGVSTSDILGGGLAGSLDLAAAGAIDVAEAAELAATAMTQLKLAGDQVGHVADLLAAGAGKAQGSVSDLGMALKQGGLVASQTGLSIEETVGTLSAFASAGLLGSDAGTSFKTMLQSLTPNSEKAAGKMAELGISAYDAQGNFVGITNFAGQLQEALSGLSTEQQNAALKIIFGSDAIRAASVLYQQGATGIQGWIDKTNDAGYAAETAATRLDNLAGDIEQFKGSLETALIGAGEGSQGPLRQLVQGATDAVNVFNNLPSSVQSSATALLGLTAVTGGALWFGSKVVNGVASTKEALEQLGVSAGKTKTALGGIGKGLQLYALVEGINLLDSALDDVFDRKIESSDLNRNLEALADGRVVDNMDQITSSLRNLNSAGLETSDTIFGFLPGDTDWNRAKENIGVVDEALASMVESGNGEQAAEVFSQIQSMVEKAGDNTSETTKWFKEYNLALDNNADSSSDVAESTGLAAGAIEDFGTDAARAADRMEMANDELRKSREAARGSAQAFFTLGDSLNDSKASLSDWISDMRQQANALRDFRVNAETAAQKGLRDGLIAALQEAGPEGAMRMKQLAGATKEQIAAANKSWQAGQREIRRYTDAVGGVPKTAGTDVYVNAEQAKRELAIIQARLASLRSKTIAINVATGGRGSADGSTVPKTGMPYADRHPYLLADGEEVISNRHGQADRHRPLLKAINAGRLADGGTSGPGKYVRPQTVGQATTEIVELRQMLHSLTKGIRESEKTIKRETAARDLLSDKVDKSQAEVDRIVGLHASLSSAIQDGLATNQFATIAGNKDPWSSGSTKDRPPTFDEIIAALGRSTDDANAFSTATGTLTSGGLSGGALQSVLEQGLGTAQMFAGLSPEQLAQYQSSFQVNADALKAAGDGGGTAVFGREMEKANQILAASQAELTRQTTELQTQSQQLRIAERQRDQAEKQLGKVKDALDEIRDEIKKARDAANSGARSRR